MLARNEQTLDEMKANLLAMKINHGRIGIEKSIVASQTTKLELQNKLKSQAQRRYNKQQARKREKKVAGIVDSFFAEFATLKSIQKRYVANEVVPYRALYTGVDSHHALKRYEIFLQKEYPRLLKSLGPLWELPFDMRQMLVAAVRMSAKIAEEMRMNELVIEGAALGSNMTLREWETVIRRRHNLTRAEIRSKRRDKPVVEARQDFFYHARKHTKYSLPQIGQYMGGFDHTTVLHGVRRHERKLALNEA